MRYPNPSRRWLISGLACTAAALAPGTPVLAASDGDPDIRLFTNLFTRIAGAVRINDLGPYLFVIDTGAAQTAIADTLLQPLRLTPGRSVRVHGINSSELAPSVEVDRLELSGRRFRNLKCPVLPRRLMGADGLLGLDVLRRFRLRFDLANQSASLINPSGGAEITFGGLAVGSRLPRGGSGLSRNAFGQMLLSQVSVDGVDATAFIDSGAQYSVANMAMRERIRLAQGSSTVDQTRSIILYGVTGQSRVAQLGEVRELRLGGRRLGATPLLFADLHCFTVMGLADQPTILIGADLLGRFREILIDFPRQTIAFNGLRARPRTFELLTG